MHYQVLVWRVRSGPHRIQFNGESASFGVIWPRVLFTPDGEEPVTGRLVKGTGAERYLLMKNVEGAIERRRIPNAATFAALGCREEALEALTDAELAAVPPGPDLPDLHDGARLAVQGAATLFGVDGGRRHVIAAGGSEGQAISDHDLGFIPVGPKR